MRTAISFSLSPHIAHGEQSFDLGRHVNLHHAVHEFRVVMKSADDHRVGSAQLEKGLGHIIFTDISAAASAVLDGKGQLVGLNFDRVWENVANDFGYNPDIARNVSVDIRYLLWLLDEVEGESADPLLEELGVSD